MLDPDKQPIDTASLMLLESVSGGLGVAEGEQEGRLFFVLHLDGATKTDGPVPTVNLAFDPDLAVDLVVAIMGIADLGNIGGQLALAVSRRLDTVTESI